jgi:hypothetical protein
LARGKKSQKRRAKEWEGSDNDSRSPLCDDPVKWGNLEVGKAEGKETEELARKGWMMRMSDQQH